MPILRYRAERARRGEPARPSQRGADHQRGQHDDSGRHPPVALGVGERTQPHLHRRTTGKRYPAQHLRQAEHQRDPDHRPQLVHVAQRCAAGVQERLYLVGQRRAQPAAVARGHQDHPDQQHRHQPPPRRHAPAGQAGQSGRRDQAGAQDGDRPGDQRRARGGGRRHERGPAVGAAQHFDQRRPLRRHAGGFDEVQERGTDVAQQDQRHHPPQDCQGEGQQRPRCIARPRPVRPMTGPPDHGGQATGQRRNRVDRAHQRDRQPGLRGEDPHRPARSTAQRKNRGQQHPRRQHHRQCLRRDRAERGQHPRRQRERHRADHPRRRAADSQRLGDPQQTPEANRQQQRPPQPLGNPPGQPQQVADQKEGAVRKQVAVGLILRLAERQVAVPQVGRPGQKAQRVRGEVEFGVGGDLPRGLRERQRQRDRPDQHQPPT